MSEFGEEEEEAFLVVSALMQTALSSLLSYPPAPGGRGRMEGE